MKKETILDELTFLLTSTGLNRSGELNNDGLIIEDIIDLFTNEP